MADISSSAAKEHVLKGAGNVQRISADAIQMARDFGHAYLAKLGGAAGAEADRAGRKTIMPQDIQIAARVLSGEGSTSAVPTNVAGGPIE